MSGIARPSVVARYAAFFAEESAFLPKDSGLLPKDSGASAEDSGLKRSEAAPYRILSLGSRERSIPAVQKHFRKVFRE